MFICAKTPLDALTTYTRAHTCLQPPPKTLEGKDEVTIPQLEKWIMELERHLLAHDDGVETQNQASDLLYHWNYTRADGGQSWNAAGMGTNQTPSDTDGSRLGGNPARADQDASRDERVADLSGRGPTHHEPTRVRYVFSVVAERNCRSPS